jgi:hypothetical protein
MSPERKFLVSAAIAAMAAVSSASAQPPLIPDLSGVWDHPVFPWFEPPASGPGPITNLSRWEQFSSDSAPALPPGKTGVSNYNTLVGDYKNPILQPWAADVVKHFGELSLEGITYGNPSNQCWPFPPPFIFKQAQVAMIQQPDRITMIYNGEHVRRVRLNAQHPSHLTPSWYGDAVGHYEGDTLVIDTVGIKADRPYAMQDLFGTPYTDRLHMVERYRLRSYDEVKDALARNQKENWLYQGDVWSRSRNGKFMQAEVTVEDGGVFTTPYSGTLTYVPRRDPIAESVCAENPNEYYNNKLSDLPLAKTPDF